MNTPTQILTVDQRIQQAKDVLKLESLVPTIIIPKELPADVDRNKYVLLEMLKVAKAMVITGPEDKAGYEKAKKLNALVRSSSGENTRYKKEAKKDSQLYENAIDAYYNDIQGVIEQIRTEVTARITAVDKAKKEKEDAEKKQLDDRYAKRYTKLIELGMVFNGLENRFEADAVHMSEEIVRNADAEMFRQLFADQVAPTLRRLRDEKERSGSNQVKWDEINNRRMQFLVDECGVDALGDGNGGEYAEKGTLRISKKSLYLYTDEKFGELCAQFAEEPHAGSTPTATGEHTPSGAAIYDADLDESEERVVTHVVDVTTNTSSYLKDADVAHKAMLRIQAIMESTLESHIGKHGFTEAQVMTRLKYLFDWFAGLEKELRKQ